MKDKLIKIWLCVVAGSIAIVMVCAAMAWVMGLAIYVMRWING